MTAREPPVVPTQEARAPVAFVVMPFAEEFSAGFRDVIRPAIERAGLDCVRADQEPLGHIHRAMFERIFDSAVVIADISGGNPNVFYELGVANSVGRRTVTVAREDFVDHVPFDVAPYRVLVYPTPPPGGSDRATDTAYAQRAAESVEALARELARVVGRDEGIPNPVQDFLASRSPLTCAESRYLESFSARWEEELVLRAERQVVHVGLTGSHFADVLAGYVDSRTGRPPLEATILLLDPEDRESWSFVYRLREGRPVTEEEVDRFLAQDRSRQQHTEDVISRLDGAGAIRGRVSYYSSVPVFWAYWVDGERIVAGHLATSRLTSRNLPVSVIVRDDPRTAVLYEYHKGAINSLQ